MLKDVDNLELCNAFSQAVSDAFKITSTFVVLLVLLLLLYYSTFILIRTQY